MRYIAILLLLATNAGAAPYFRLIGTTDKIHKVTGASVDPLSPGQTSFVTEVALITHSTKDGCFLPSIVCEDWSPLMIGPSYSAGRFALVFGPVMNLAPATKQLLLRGLNMVTEQDKFGGLKAILAPSEDSVTISFGPQLWINPAAHGTILPLNRWQPAGRIFAGTALRF